MKEILENRLVKINTYLNDAIEECSRESINYYEGQKELVISLLKEIEPRDLEWECYEGTLHSGEEQCNCPSYQNYSSQQDYYEDTHYLSPDDASYDIDEFEWYQTEKDWIIKKEIDDMYNKYYHFSLWIPRKILSVDNLWFTSDEIEAFRVIWQRRISAM